MSPGYHPVVYEITEFDEDGINTYQDLIIVLRFDIQIGRDDILLEVALPSIYLEMSKKVHL